jgi:hypothetical protein
VTSAAVTLAQSLSVKLPISSLKRVASNVWLANGPERMVKPLVRRTPRQASTNTSCRYVQHLVELFILRPQELDLVTMQGYTFGCVQVCSGVCIELNLIYIIQEYTYVWERVVLADLLGARRGHSTLSRCVMSGGVGLPRQRRFGAEGLLFACWVFLLRSLAFFPFLKPPIRAQDAHDPTFATPTPNHG